MAARAGRPWGPGGRRLLKHNQINPEYTADELEFARAMDAYKRDHQRPYPDCRDVLLVFRSLGYRKVCDTAPDPVRR